MNQGTYEWLESVAMKMGEDALKELNQKIEEDKDDNGRMNAYSENTYSLLVHPFEEVLSRLSEIFAQGYLQGKNVGLDDEKIGIIETIYQHYDFFEQQLGAFFEKYEPRGCDFDKASFILNSFLHFTATGEYVSFTKGEKEFWKPKLGTAEQWMTFVSSLLWLRNGKPESYMKSYSELVGLYMVGVEQEKNRLHDIITSSPYYKNHEVKDEDLYYHLASGEETGTVRVDVVGTHRVRYYTPEMKGIKLTDKIRRRMTFTPPDWVKELSFALGKL